jgi:hypothetical protein
VKDLDIAGVQPEAAFLRNAHGDDSSQQNIQGNALELGKIASNPNEPVLTNGGPVLNQ